MPKVVKNWPKKSPRNGDDFWAPYADGSIYKFEESEILQRYKSLSSARSTVYAYATPRGLRARTRMTESTFYVQFYGDGEV